MRAAVPALLALLAAATPAAAHPHVFITAKAVVAFGPDGRITGVRHAWTFDEAYSAFLVTGLETGADGKVSPKALAELAKVNAESLAEFDYFTSLKAGGTKSFGAPKDYRLEQGAGPAKPVTLHFTLPLAAPVKPAPAATMEVADRTWFVAFTVPEAPDAVTLEGAPPGCKAEVKRPPPATLAGAAKLTEGFFQGLTADSPFGATLGTRVLIACP